MGDSEGVGKVPLGRKRNLDAIRTKRSCVHEESPIEQEMYT